MLGATFKPRLAVAVHDFSQAKESEAENLPTHCRMNTSPHYSKRGVLDVTHTRLFTFRSVRELLKQSGYQISRNSRAEAKPAVNNLLRETVSGSDALKAEVLGQGGLMAEGSGQRRFKNVKRAHEVVRN